MATLAMLGISPGDPIGSGSLPWHCSGATRCCPFTATVNSSTSDFEMSSKAFSVACATAVLSLVGCVGLFNRIVDPYGYFRDVQIIGFNYNKPKAAGNERLVKPAWAAKLKPEAVILGGSVAEIGLPPTHRGFTKDGALVPFNLAMPGATWNETYCLAMFAMRHMPVKRMVVGISGTDEGMCPADATLGSVDYGKLLFSRSAFDASRKTVSMQHQRETLTREGLWSFERYDSQAQTDDEVARNFAVYMQSALCASVSIGPEVLDRVRLRKAGVARDHGVGLRKLIRLALERQVELVLLFPPTHVLMSEAQRSCQGPEAQWNWVWQIVSIVAQETGGNSRQIQVWQFADYVPMNGERIHAGKPGRDRLWQDSIHFNEEVGVAVFDAIYLGVPSYGARVTVANFDELIAGSEDQRRQFLADNPWVPQELDETVRRARDSGGAVAPMKVP